jgi:NADH-quinone oxidoreductase subunit G
MLDPANGRTSYLFNATVAGIDDCDAVAIIGSNPRREAPVLNARIRKRWLRGDLPVAVIGEKVDLTYSYDYLGAGADSLPALAEHAIAKAKKPLILIGQGALAREDGAAIMAAIEAVAAKFGPAEDGWNRISILHTAAARVGGLDLGLVPGEGGLAAAAMAKGGVDVLFNLGADEIEIAPGPFVIYQGTHGDRGAHRADVILPGSAYTEKSATYVNTEGRVQMTDRATFPPGEAKEDWAILRALSDVLGHKLPFDNLGQLRQALYQAQPHFAGVDQITAAPVVARKSVKHGAPSKAAFVSTVNDFYLTNPIARASAVMAECSALARGALAVAAE